MFPRPPINTCTHTHTPLHWTKRSPFRIHSSFRSWWTCWTPWRPPSRTAPWPPAPWASGTRWATPSSPESRWWRATSEPIAPRRTSARSGTCATPIRSASARSAAAASSASWDRKYKLIYSHFGTFEAYLPQLHQQYVALGSHQKELSIKDIYLFSVLNQVYAKQEVILINSIYI